MFRITEHKGFQITFANGYTISCQFGYGNYCERKFEGTVGIERDMHTVSSKNCEVAIWMDDGPFITGEIIDAANIEVENDGQVAGYVSPEDVAKLIAYISSL